MFRNPTPQPGCIIAGIALSVSCDNENGCLCLWNQCYCFRVIVREIGCQRLDTETKMNLPSKAICKTFCCPRLGTPENNDIFVLRVRISSQSKPFKDPKHCRLKLY